MSDKSGIEWTDATLNVTRGCSPVSAGCSNCYAARMASRFSGPGMLYERLAKGGKWTGKIRPVPEVLEQPLRWRKPRKIFVNSMSDLFHPGVSFEFILEVFEVMEHARWHTFQVLTKRPERAIEFCRRYGIGDQNDWPVNVWLGVSAENQEMADERVPLLLQTPAAVWFVSCEPLLGPVDLERFFVMHDRYGEPFAPRCNPDGSSALGWVVCGGESGPGARPIHPDWVRDIRDQCQAAGVPFLFKQWGEWLPINFGEGYQDDKWRCRAHYWPKGWTSLRVGKKAAGRELDGEIWDQYPQAPVAVGPENPLLCGSE